MKNMLLVPELREYVQNDDWKSLQDFFENTHPGVFAEFLSGLEPAEVWEILRRLAPEQRVEVFSELEEDLQIEVTGLLGRNELASLVSDMRPDDRVDLLKLMPEEKRGTLLPAIAQAEREDIKRLLSYPEGSAGAIMTTEYATLRPDITAAEAFTKLRHEAPDKETIYSAYVLDEARILVGFVSLKDLILARPNVKVEDIMHRDLIFAQVEDDQEEVAEKVQKYGLLALPVVDEGGHLVGIVTHDDVFDVVAQEQNEDMEKFMAIGGTHAVGVYMKTPAWVHLKRRCLWIVLLAILGLVSGMIVQNFEGLLLQFAILASFMPMLADTGGNTGSQSATLVIRALALGEICSGDAGRVVLKEFLVALPLGMVLAVFAFGRVMLLGGGSGVPEDFPLHLVGLAISAALAVQVVTSALMGALLPLTAAKLKLDPAVVASPAITTIVDISGLLIFFSIAHAMLGF